MSKITEAFASRKGVTTDAIFHPDGGFGLTKQAEDLQQDLSHFERGWTAYLASPTEATSREQAAAMAHASYERLTNRVASLGAISRTEYVAGFVAAYESRI